MNVNRNNGSTAGGSGGGGGGGGSGRSKRKPISFPELDALPPRSVPGDPEFRPRGRGAILRSREELLDDFAREAELADLAGLAEPTSDPDRLTLSSSVTEPVDGPLPNAADELPANRQIGNTANRQYGNSPSLHEQSQSTPLVPSPPATAPPSEAPTLSVPADAATGGELDWQERRKISVRWPDGFIDEMAAAAKRIRRRRPDGRNVSLEQAIYLYAFAGRIDELERGDESTFARLQAEFLRHATQPAGPRTSRRDDFVELASQPASSPLPGSPDPKGAFNAPEISGELPANRQIGYSANRIAYLPNSRFAGPLIDIESSTLDERNNMESDDSISINGGGIAGNSANRQNVPAVEGRGQVGAAPDQEGGYPDPDHDSDAGVIGRFISSWQAELGDQEAVPGASTARAIRLYQGSRMELPRFLEAMRTARDITRNKGQDVIRKRTLGPDGKPTDTPNRMPYWFAVLEDLCGLKEY